MTSLDQLAARAAALAGGRGRAILGITGSPGAGKSTLVERLLEVLRQEPPGGKGPDWVAHVPMDGFHLADVELDRLGRRARKGAPDTFDVAGYAALLARIREDGDGIVYAPAFERELEQPIAGSIPVTPRARLVITEGNYLLLDRGGWDRVADLLDEVWFCRLDDAERRRRLVARHTLFGKEHDHAVAWVDEVDQRNAGLVEATRDRADLVVSVDDVLRSGPWPGTPDRESMG